MSGQGAAASTGGLPKQFVTSLRILFDILDEERTGSVRLCDIESRWHEEGVRGLPSGVIDSLRKVAPKSGKLNFETFVNGLKLSLLKTNSNGSSASSSNLGKENKARTVSAPQVAKPADARKPSHSHTDVRKPSHSHTDVRKPSHSQVELRNPHPSQADARKLSQTQSQRDNTSAPSSQRGRQISSRHLPQPTNTATVRPNNVLQSQNIELRNQIYSREQQQQSSIRQHVKAEPTAYRDTDAVLDRNKVQVVKQDDNYTRRNTEHLAQKPRPKSVELQRTRDNLAAGRLTDIPTGRPERPPPYRSHEHHDVLTTGRPDRPPPYRKQLDKEPAPAIPPRDNMHGKIMQELKQWRQDHNLDFQGKLHTTHSDSKLLEKNNGNDIYVNIDQIRQQAAIFKKSPPVNATQCAQVRRTNSRRHTLSSGIDYNVIRRMKQLEKEKDELLQGLEVVERARQWYLQQIAQVTEKQNGADKTSCTDLTLQANQEKMNFIRSRITEVNLNLRSLMETSEKGIPAHMNLAMRGDTMRSDTAAIDNSMKWMKDQNRQLTKEVGEKGEKITQLEKEKASLIRDLFEARTRHKTNYDDSTFM